MHCVFLDDALKTLTSKVECGPRFEFEMVGEDIATTI